MAHSPYYALLLLAFAASARAGGVLIARGAQASAVCGGNFTWADNSNGLSPCLVAANVLGACFGGNFNLYTLSPGTHYTMPGDNATAANFCTCSWAAYNLLGACTACQGLPQNIQNWTPEIVPCKGFLTNQWFPPKTTLALPDGLTVPFWAGTDPTTWPNERFDVTAAQNIAAQGHADLSQTVKTSKKSTPVGAIVGGVVGGIAVIAAIASIWLFFIFKYRRAAPQLSSTAPGSYSRNPPTIHGRSFSDLSSKFGGVGTGYSSSQPFSSSAIHMPRNPTGPTSLQTHNSSVHSLTHFGSAASTLIHTTPSPPPRSQASPSPTMQHVMSRGSPSPTMQHVMSRGSPSPTMQHVMNREEIITPFALQANLSPIPETPRKGVNPVYDSPNAPPVIRADDPPVVGSTTPARSRVNPPAYTPQGDQSTSPTRPPHVKNDSGDSWETTRSGATWASAGTAAAPVGNIDGVVNQISMGTVMPPTAVNNGYPSNSNQPIVAEQAGQLSSFRRDQKRRPTNPDEHLADDITDPRRDIA